MIQTRVTRKGWALIGALALAIAMTGCASRTVDENAGAGPEPASERTGRNLILRGAAECRALLPGLQRGAGEGEGDSGDHQAQQLGRIQRGQRGRRQAMGQRIELDLGQAPVEVVVVGEGIFRRAALDEFLRQRPELLDPAGRLLYRAYSLALVQLLIENDEGHARLGRYIDDLSFASNDPLRDLEAVFPESLLRVRRFLRVATKPTPRVRAMRDRLSMV